jgi:arylsulfatase A-like enzyme
VDLEREAYWTGRVEALRLTVDRGRLDLLEITGEPAADAYRSMSLRGESLPALPGLGRIEIDLPRDLPRRAVFEARLGLVPEFDRPGVKAVFRARLAGGDGKPWLEETVEGSQEKSGAGWHPLWEEFPWGAAGRRLILEVEATRNGAPLPEGVALWGDPVVIAPGPSPGPNLVVVLVDTLRADVVGAYGDRHGLTPRLDAFARQAVRFEEMTSPAPWTLPSVSSLMTGLQPQTHGAGIRYGDFAPTGLSGGVRTLAETLGDAGFYNVGVYHNIYVNPAFGLQQGFDEYVSLEERAGVLVDDALGRLRRVSSDRRFFLYFHVFDPHNPYEPPEEECRSVARRLEPGYRGSLGCSADRRPELPIPPPEDRRWHEALYRAEVAYTDRQIGRLLDGLREMGLDENTVVLIVSDHGEEFWTRLDREKALGYEANADHGHTLYRELLHVPALLRVPGRAPGVLRGPAETVDLFPTLLRLVGVEPPPNEGQDLTPRLDGGQPAQRPTLVADVILHGPSRWSVRRGPWKLVVPREEGLPVELYNLEQDPGESRDLSAAQPQVVTALRELGERTLARRQRERGRYRSGDESLGATYLEWNHITKLRSLGYLK